LLRAKNRKQCWYGESIGILILNAQLPLCAGKRNHDHEKSSLFGCRKPRPMGVVMCSATMPKNVIRNRNGEAMNRA